MEGPFSYNLRIINSGKQIYINNLCECFKTNDFIKCTFNLLKSSKDLMLELYQSFDKYLLDTYFTSSINRLENYQSAILYVCMILGAEVNTINNIPIMKFFQTYAHNRVSFVFWHSYIWLHKWLQFMNTTSSKNDFDFSVKSSICL